MRVGVIAKKLGMSAVFDQKGVRIPVTILEIDSCQVIGHKKQDSDGYNSVQVGAFNFKNKNKVSKPLKGYFDKNSIDPKKKLKEFRVSSDAFVDIGDEICVNHYVPNQRIDITAFSIGKGFAGSMKRHNFGGLRASHGVSVSHRSHGSTGQCQDPGKVFKGKKMAGHMGNRRTTIQNIQVVSIDEDRSLLMVKGGVPGAKNAYVIINDAKKAALPANAPYPAAKKSFDSANKISSSDAKETASEDSSKS